ncbi:hypothetical protein HY375_01695 [Candidatus Berkelbacteria bacterium]|nr:hypothetical protein [Candidatus Berkelbacteria bacterium]
MFKVLFVQTIGLVMTLGLAGLALGSLRLLWAAHRDNGSYSSRTPCWPERRTWWLRGASCIVAAWSAYALGRILAPDTWLWFFLVTYTTTWLTLSTHLSRTMWRTNSRQPRIHRLSWGVAIFALMGGTMTVLATTWSLFMVAAIFVALPRIWEWWSEWFQDVRYRRHRPVAALGMGLAILVGLSWITVMSGRVAIEALLGTKVIVRAGGVVTPPPPPPPVALPKWILGKGVWIVNLDHAEGGDLEAIVAKAKKYHADHLLVKLFDSEWDEGPWIPFHGADIRPVAKELIALAHAEGIKVYLWGYVYGKRTQWEIGLVRECLMLNPDGFVYDAEGECKKEGRTENLEEICRSVTEWRDKYRPNALLGFSSFDGTIMHADGGFPYAVFDRYCEVFIPQCYWKDDATGTPADRLSWASEQWVASAAKYRARGAGKSFDRILPAGHAYDPRLNSNLREIPYEEVVDFLERAEGFWGVSLYTYEFMGPEQWQGFRDGPGSLREKAERYGEELRKAREAKRSGKKGKEG